MASTSRYYTDAIHGLSQTIEKRLNVHLYSSPLFHYISQRTTLLAGILFKAINSTNEFITGRRTSTPKCRPTPTRKVSFKLLFTTL